MKNLKYYSLTALGASSVYARKSAYKGQYFNAEGIQFAGKAGIEVVFPMNVDVKGSKQ